MATSFRCKITGCDLDDCGVCRRCGDRSKAEHLWEEVEREKPCFRRIVCERCGREKEQPDHDWESTERGLECSRCRLVI